MQNNRKKEVRKFKIKYKYNLNLKVEVKGEGRILGLKELI